MPWPWSTQYEVLLSSSGGRHDGGVLSGRAVACRRSSVAGLLLLAAAGTFVATTFRRGPAGDAEPTISADLRAVLNFIDWDHVTKLPPWLSPIKERARKGVALVCGQSLKPDGSAPQVLLDRARMAKKLLDAGKVDKVIVSGGDPAGVGHTEASKMAGVLRDAGIPNDKIIQEAQATTTAENAWFALRWLPRGTGQFYIVTSDFHMARATYIFQETLNYFYSMVEDAYRDHPRWLNPRKKYPRLTIHQAPTKSFCGNASEGSAAGDINERSLAKRALDELGYLGTGEVSDSMFGEPRSKIMYIWPIQIDVEKDPANKANFEKALAQATNAAQGLCSCTAPPEPPKGGGGAGRYPLSLPIPDKFPPGMDAGSWKRVQRSCNVRQ